MKPSPPMALRTWPNLKLRPFLERQNWRCVRVAAPKDVDCTRGSATEPQAAPNAREPRSWRGIWRSAQSAFPSLDHAPYIENAKCLGASFATTNHR